jgi:hypothetical protein
VHCAACYGSFSVTTALVLDDGTPYDLLDVLEIAGDVARVRSPFLFEIGEELTVRIEQDGQVFEAQARVKSHVGPPEMRITELELSEQTEPRNMVTG